jgi:hypothetical protein
MRESRTQHAGRPEDLFLTRRELLGRSGMGLGALALADLMGRAAPLGAQEPRGGQNPLAPKAPPFAPKARRIIHIFANGGPSQVDTFDPKPLLGKYAGKPLPSDYHPPTERKTGNALPSPFKFLRGGTCGTEISEIFSELAGCADDLCVIRSMHADLPNHDPSILLMNCGDGRLDRPSMGSWLLYGLGSESRNLPGFMVISPGTPVCGKDNWRSSFLPGVTQGIHLDTRRPTQELIGNLKNLSMPREEQRRQLDLLGELNRQYHERVQADAAMEARIHTFEMAFRMQAEASDALDVSREPKAIRELYGPGLQATQMLMARRLVERGVRYVQIYHGDQQPWDTHDANSVGQQRLARESDRAVAGLLKDLKQRGMLDDTLVLWGGEFGRTPATENKDGRDHNHWGFSMWMAGGGAKGGHVHGSTDDFGYKAIKDPVHVHDLHATILRLMGFDHEKFTYRHAGRDFRLTDVQGEVVDGLLA